MPSLIIKALVLGPWFVVLDELLEHHAKLTADCSAFGLGNIFNADVDVSRYKNTFPFIGVHVYFLAYV